MTLRNKEKWSLQRISGLIRLAMVMLSITNLLYGKAKPDISIGFAANAGTIEHLAATELSSYLNFC